MQGWRKVTLTITSIFLHSGVRNKRDNILNTRHIWIYYDLISLSATSHKKGEIHQKRRSNLNLPSLFLISPILFYLHHPLYHSTSYTLPETRWGTQTQGHSLWDRSVRNENSTCEKKERRLGEKKSSQLNLPRLLSISSVLFSFPPLTNPPVTHYRKHSQGHGLVKQFMR